ncbi:FHA domain-containing protein [Myxococcus fulvus]|nr:FHA domain-containing protein [Myxococcus fulvus]
MDPQQDPRQGQRDPGKRPSAPLPGRLTDGQQARLPHLLGRKSCHLRGMHDLWFERAFCYDCTRIGPVLKLIIEDDEGRKTVVPFVRDEITIGRQEGNTIRLTERNVSRRHARLVRLNGHVVVEDLGSYNGTRINGERIAGQSPLNEGDLIQIGDYDLALQAEGAANAVGPITTKVPARRQETEPDEPEGSEDESPGDGEENDHTPPSLDGADKRRNSTSIIRLDHVEADRPRKLEDIDTKDAPRLVVLTPDELRGQEFACIRTELRIGRTDDNDITLDHRSLSRTHAKLVRENTGEWRVIDMQSANGMTVNGESYAQATLNSGDVVELGHVKLRFLAAGDAADEAEEQGASEGGMSKLPLVAGLVALLLGGGVIFWMYKQGQIGGTPQPVDPVAVAQTPKPVDPPPVVPVKQPPEDVKPPETVAQPETPPEAPAAPAKPTFKELMEKAKAAFDSKNLELAESTLAELPEGDKSRKDAKELQDKIDSEKNAQTQLENTQKALDAGKLAEAQESLKAGSGTVFQKDRYAELSKQVGLLEKKKQAEAAAAQTPKNPTVVTPAGGTETIPKADENPIKKLVLETRELIKQQKYQDALVNAEKCAVIDPRSPDCELLLGITFARLNRSAEGASHYRKFLELAPQNHPSRNGVLELLKAYDNSSR